MTADACAGLARVPVPLGMCRCTPRATTLAIQSWFGTHPWSVFAQYGLLYGSRALGTQLERVQLSGRTPLTHTDDDRFPAMIL